MCVGQHRARPFWAALHCEAPRPVNSPCTDTLLTCAAQLDLRREDRMAQGHRDSVTHSLVCVSKGKSAPALHRDSARREAWQEVLRHLYLSPPFRCLHSTLPKNCPLRRHETLPTEDAEPNPAQASTAHAPQQQHHRGPGVNVAILRQRSRGRPCMGTATLSVRPRR